MTLGYIPFASCLLLILLWNTPPHPSDDICDFLDKIYQTHAPSVPKSARYQSRETHQANFKEIGQNIINSGLFKDLIFENLVYETTHTIDNYLALLTTMSPYIKLEQQQRDSLLIGLKEELEKHCRVSLATSYLSALQVAKVKRC